MYELYVYNVCEVEKNYSRVESVVWVVHVDWLGHNITLRYAV